MKWVRFWHKSETWGAFFSGINNLPFYKAMGFTLAYTFIVTPLTIILGFMIAVAVNNAPRAIRGLSIFFFAFYHSLLRRLLVL